MAGGPRCRPAPPRPLRVMLASSEPRGLLVEGLGKRLPIVAMPFTNRAQAAHPVFEENTASLRSWGVTVLYGPDVYRLHEPDEGGNLDHAFPWHLTLDALSTRQRQLGPGGGLPCGFLRSGRVALVGMLGSQSDPGLRHVAHLGEHRARNEQWAGMGLHQVGASLMVRVVRVEDRNQRSGVTDDHAERRPNSARSMSSERAAKSGSAILRLPGCRAADECHRHRG